MHISLEDSARQCLLIVRESSLLKKLALLRYWQAIHVANDEQLWLAVAHEDRNVQRRLLLVGEEDVARTASFLKSKGSSLIQSKLGIVVLARDPVTWLKDGHYSSDVLDVAPEREFRKNSTYYLLRALRQLMWMEDRSRSKVNQHTLEKLNQIFIALSAERDPEKLLATILVKALELVSAEEGTLYMINETDGEINFRLKITCERHNEVTIKPLQLKVSENSVSGYVALTGKTLNIADVADLRPLTLPQLNKSLDHYKEERTKALLTLPLKNSRNEIIAILQLSNKHEDEPARENQVHSPAFGPEEESLLASFCTQAAICLENVDLYADIQRLFEGFVKASITAIESRDPSTGGHSERVAKLCVAIARATTECEVGIYRSVRFKDEEIRELEYAALLHDFGKIGVREEVLVKAKKLYSWQLDSIKERIKVCKAAAKIAYLEHRLKHGSSEGEQEYQRRVREIDTYWDIINAANEPAVLKLENMEAMERIRNEQLLLPDGQKIALLSEEEYRALSVTQGSLTENERLEIESHVRHTYQFLKMIPWTKDFKHLPEIAYAHHEKLDGSGYPRGLTSHEIPLQSKIMTISDIFDALTAADRWYKEAVPTERALDILSQEVNQGKIDPVLFELFVEKKLFEVTQPSGKLKIA
jgi:HD-GYP domain-containing protein (c-di-GMP phosphodiesterase class II)